LTETRDEWAEWLVRTRFDTCSPEETEQWLASLRAIRDRVLDGARLDGSEVVVDVGTGTGLLAIGALERLGEDGEVVAVDPSVDCLEELRATCSDPRLWYEVGGAEVLPLPDASVDAVLARSVLIYVRDKAQAAREFFRVLRQGGRVSIFEPVNRNNTRLWDVVDFGSLAPRVAEDFRRRWPADDPACDFDVPDLARFFDDAGFAGVQTDVESPLRTVGPDTVLFGVSMPGAPRLVDAWRDSFSEEEVDLLVAAVRDAGEVLTVLWPAVYLTATKP
jgi:arsenite methyltransferase